MLNRRLATRGVLLAALAAATVGIAACGSQQGAAGPTTSSMSGNPQPAGSGTSTQVVPPPATSGGTTPSGSSSSGTGTQLRECKAADLKLSFGAGDAAAGHTYQALQFTNKSSTPCVMVGFPGVSYVAGPNGQQVGAPAQRDGAIGSQLTLAPNQMASSIITVTDVGVFDPGVCKPTATNGFRIYAPDDTAAMFIAESGTGCAGNTPDPQLRVQTVKSGPGNP